MEKVKFMKRAFLWAAIIVAAIVAIIGITCGKVIEATLFAEVAKWVVMGIFLIVIIEVFVYILGPLVWHIIYDKKAKK